MFLFLAGIPALVHSNPYSDFESRVNAAAIKPFALDLGGLLGASSFHSGRSLGMPGFEAGVVGVVQSKPDRNNLILRNSGIDAFGLPLVRGAVGLPFNIDIAAHGIKLEGASVIGGGLRYGIFQSSLLTQFLPSVGISAFGDRVTHRAFRAEHFGFSVCAGWDIPIITPFIGVGLDSTRVTVKAATAAGVVGFSEIAKGYRATLGADVTPFPFMRLRGAYLLLHGVVGGMASLGVQF